MQGFLGLLVGIGLAFALLRLLPVRLDAVSPTARPSALAWAALGLGSAALLMVAAGLLAPLLAETGAFQFAIASPAVLSIVLAVAASIAAIGSLVKGDRHWPGWAALVIAALPTLFWLAFLAGEIAFPHG